MGCVVSLKSDCDPCRNLNLPCIDRNPEADDIHPYAPARRVVMAEDHDNAQYDDIDEEDIYTELDDTARDQETYTIPVPQLPAEGAGDADRDGLTELADSSANMAAKLTVPQVRASVALSVLDMSISSPTIEDFNRRFLECSICLDHFKKPKILPCYHSFCQQCLEKAFGDEPEKIACPMCKREHQLPPEGGIKDLPNCTILNDLIEFAKPAQKDEGNVSAVHLCGCCKKKKAENFCVDCGILICADCSETHKNIPVTKKHQLMTLDEYRDKILVQSQVYRPVVCPLHEGNQITYYCGTCEVPACEQCTTEKHRRQSHQLELLKEATSKRRTQLQHTIDGGKARIRDLRQTRTALDAKEKAYQDKLGKESEILGKGLGELAEMLRKTLAFVENEKATLLKELENAREKRLSAFEARKRQINTSLSEVSKCVSDANTLYHHSNEVGFLYLASRTKAQIDLALAGNVPTSTVDFKPLKLSTEEKLQEIQTTTFDLLLANRKD